MMDARMANPDEIPRRYLADVALARLIAGNKRFVRGKARFPTVRKEVLANLAKWQEPYATILGCSDSRVPPELVFDAGFGDLFIIRVAGNVIAGEVLGTLQYAALHLRTPLFVVLGHEGCGAVDAALATLHHGTTHGQHIARLVGNILPCLKGVSRLPSAAQRNAAVEANVRWSMQQIRATREGRLRRKEGFLKLVGAIYEIRTGRVPFLE
jgi:carbonic anhydrase